MVSTQHDDFIPTSKGVTEKMAEKRMQEKIREDVRTILIPRVKARLERAKDKLARLIGDDYILHVNPTGKFVIGGPHGDTGLTGRKIIVDSYGGRGAHGGGAFSGKARRWTVRQHAARYIAKNMVAAGIADEILVELSYAIGIAEPISRLRRYARCGMQPQSETRGHDRRGDRPPYRQGSSTCVRRLS